jgi:hypothetical protein
MPQPREDYTHHVRNGRLQAALALVGIWVAVYLYRIPSRDR